MVLRKCTVHGGWLKVLGEARVCHMETGKGARSRLGDSHLGILQVFTSDTRGLLRTASLYRPFLPPGAWKEGGSSQGESSGSWFGGLRFERRGKRTWFWALDAVPIQVWVGTRWGE